MCGRAAFPLVESDGARCNWRSHAVTRVPVCGASRAIKEKRRWVVLSPKKRLFSFADEQCADCEELLKCTPDVRVEWGPLRAGDEADRTFTFVVAGGAPSVRLRAPNRAAWQTASGRSMMAAC